MPVVQEATQNNKKTSAAKKKEDVEMKDVSESNAKGKKGQKNLGSGKKQVAPKNDTSAQ